MAAPDQILARVTTVLVQSLGVDEDDVTPAASLPGDRWAVLSPPAPPQPIQAARLLERRATSSSPRASANASGRSTWCRTANP